MLLSEMGLRPHFNYSSDLDFWDMDQNHDWINDSRKRYVNLEDIDTFLSRNSRINEENIILINYWILNKNQKIVFKWIESHYHDILEGHQDESLRIIMMGTAGTGKTYLIETIWSRLQEMIEGSKLPIAVLLWQEL